MTTLDSSKVFEAKQKLRKLRPKGETITLDRYTCQLIVDAGGPTFKPLAHRYFRCRQSGHKVRNCEVFRRLVFGKIAKGKPRIEIQKSTIDDDGTVQCPNCYEIVATRLEGKVQCTKCKEHFLAELPALRKAYTYGYYNSTVRCPRCGITDNVEKAGIKKCWDCKEKYQVVKS